MGAGGPGHHEHVTLGSGRVFGAPFLWALLGSPANLRPGLGSAMVLRISGSLKTSMPGLSPGIWTPWDRTQAFTAFKSLQFIFNLFTTKNFNPTGKK